MSSQTWHSGFICSLDLERNLHPLACRSSQKRREWPIPDEEDGTASRSPFSRDRDRITFTRAFRRLAHKTQVYVTTHSNQHIRTRLTHTLEVAQIAKAMARNLRMNEDLAEAMAFGHDIGHTPFGHAGERQLDAFLKGEERLPQRVTRLYLDPDSPELRGSEQDFKHNFQSVRLLTFLEDHTPQVSGQNITFQTLEGIVKHTRIKAFRRDRNCEYPLRPEVREGLRLDVAYPSTVEGHILAIADEIAQVAHDLGDALDMDVIRVGDLYDVPAFIRLEQRARKSLRKEAWPERYSLKVNDTAAKAQVVSILVHTLATDTVHELRREIDRLPGETGAPEIGGWLCGGRVPTDEFEELKAFKDNLVINNFGTNRMDNKGAYLIRRLVDAYVSDPRQLPDGVLARYLLFKQRELKLPRGEFETAIRESQRHLQDRNRLTEEHIRGVINLIASGDRDKVLRRISHELFDRMVPLLAVDTDYRRAIADHIANMTDAYAEQEVAKLYS